MFDGTLTDGADDVLLFPSVWETDRLGSAYQTWYSLVPSLRPTRWAFRPVVVRLRREDLEPFFTGSTITAPNGSHGFAFPITFAESGSNPTTANYVLWLWVEKRP